MANLGMADSLILMVMALVVFGPRRLPQIGRQIGKLMYEFRKASNDFKFQMEEELRTSEEADRRKKEDERVKALAVPAPEVVVVKAGSTDAESTDVVTTATEPAAEETYPRILPPSTGETVAAARPNSAALAAEQSVAIDDPAPAPAAEASAEAMMSEGAPAVPGAPEPEQAAHHG
jgi:sec-independent protein translocase protein TatB